MFVGKTRNNVNKYNFSRAKCFSFNFFFYYYFIFNLVCQYFDLRGKLNLNCCKLSYSLLGVAGFLIKEKVNKWNENLCCGCNYNHFFFYFLRTFLKMKKNIYIKHYIGVALWFFILRWSLFGSIHSILGLLSLSVQ